MRGRERTECPRPVARPQHGRVRTPPSQTQFSPYCRGYNGLSLGRRRDRGTRPISGPQATWDAGSSSMKYNCHPYKAQGSKEPQTQVLVFRHWLHGVCWCPSRPGPAGKRDASAFGGLVGNGAAEYRLPRGMGEASVGSRHLGGHSGVGSLGLGLAGRGGLSGDGEGKLRGSGWSGGGRLEC